MIRALLRRLRPDRPPPAVVGGRLTPTPSRGLVIRSAESTRMTRLRSMPVERRQPAVDEFLRNAR